MRKHLAAFVLSAIVLAPCAPSILADAINGAVNGVSQAVAAQGPGMPQQPETAQGKNADIQKENANIRQVNEKIAEAKTAADAGDLETAIARMTEASQMGSGYDVVWSKLAEYLRLSALKQTNPTEKSNRLAKSVADYQKAIDIKQKAIDAESKTPEAPKLLAAYYNNMADSLSKEGKINDSIKAYNQAATLNPERAATSYFNIGAVLTNAGKVDDAIVAFDKVIATDPTSADAYYWKGVNLAGKVAVTGNRLYASEALLADNMTAADGATQALKKYLELAPAGQYADPAKHMLASIGATTETNHENKNSEPIIPASESPSLSTSAPGKQSAMAPLSIGDVEHGLKAGVSNTRMATLVKQYGVDFELTDVLEKQLREAGANDELLLGIARTALSAKDKAQVAGAENKPGAYQGSNGSDSNAAASEGGGSEVDAHDCVRRGITPYRADGQPIPANPYPVVALQNTCAKAVDIYFCWLVDTLPGNQWACGEAEIESGKSTGWLQMAEKRLACVDGRPPDERPDPGCSHFRVVWNAVYTDSNQKPARPNVPKRTTPQSAH